MFDKRIGIGGLLVGIGLGVGALASPSVSWTLREFTEGLLGIPPESLESTADRGELRAEFAASKLASPLQTAERDELLQGMIYRLNGPYSQAIPILGKYALRGDARAQSLIGGMYYLGHGVPPDREEGIRWLRLAAAQGERPDFETLAAAVNGTLEWDRPEADPELAYARSQQPTLQYDLGVPAQSRSYNSSGSGVGGSYGSSSTPQSSAPMGARSSVEEAYGSASASRRYLEVQTGLPQTDLPQTDRPQAGSASTVILIPAGPGIYSDRNGDVYTQAGPNGVVNIRTGEISPTN